MSFDPIDIPTLATVTFVSEYVPVGATVLEIGCGDGHVCEQLGLAGYEHVIGIDSDESAIARATRRGVSVRHASWPDYESAQVDAILFARSLHHIDPLDKAIQRSKQLLNPDGIVLVEDFAYDMADAATIEWLLEVIRLPQVEQQLDHGSSSFISRILEASDPVAAWREDHDHDLHSAEEMAEAIADCYAIKYRGFVPYLYRYLVPALPATKPAMNCVEFVMREEIRMANEHRIQLIGRRIVGV